ncbi:hypothetical protein ABIF63_005774 [Bradyrhizobium japonicum]|uniref:Uncharacterized protein n=1 Tax=Bradyrhizobium japonicum TaxID=375 RepID=A0ABV2RXL0_BRAJP
MDIHHLLWSYAVMLGLKQFLYRRAAPVLDLSGAALYERLRALVDLGAIDVLPGRGPGSGVPFTPQNFAVVLISLLGARSLSEVDQYVVDLCNAPPAGTLPKGTSRTHWLELGKPTFASDFGRILSGKNTVWRHSESRPRNFGGVRVTRPWRAQIIDSPSGANPITYYPDDSDKFMFEKSINITAEIGGHLLSNLVKICTDDFD